MEWTIVMDMALMDVVITIMAMIPVVDTLMSDHVVTMVMDGMVVMVDLVLGA